MRMFTHHSVAHHNHSSDGLSKIRAATPVLEAGSGFLDTHLVFARADGIIESACTGVRRGQFETREGTAYKTEEAS